MGVGVGASAGLELDAVPALGVDTTLSGRVLSPPPGAVAKFYRVRLLGGLLVAVLCAGLEAYPVRAYVRGCVAVVAG